MKRYELTSRAAEERSDVTLRERGVAGKRRRRRKLAGFGSVFACFVRLFHFSFTS